VDLFTFPWPFEDNSVDEVHCSHFIEHIPLRDVEARDIVSNAGQGYAGHDMLLVFFDELYRILKPTGKATIVWPALQSKRAFQDPTHRRFIPDFTMAYLSKSERKGMKLDHYPVSCDFVASVGYSAPDTLSLLHPEAAARRMHEGWNVIYDYIATLTPIK
jgi:SAM-dependent methyltransferase